jgi:hypothetical protein
MPVSNSQFFPCLAIVCLCFLNQRKHFFRIFVLIGSRVFSLILLTGFHFRRRFSKSDLLSFLVLICSKKSIWYQMRYQILLPFKISFRGVPEAGVAHVFPWAQASQIQSQRCKTSSDH